MDTMKKHGNKGRRLTANHKRKIGQSRQRYELRVKAALAAFTENSHE